MIRELIQSVTGYPGLFLFCVSSGIVLPIPEDISLLYAGSRLQAGEMAWVPTLLVAMAGVMCRDVIAYGIGRLLGDWLLARPFAQRVIGERRLERARSLVEDHGAGAVLAGRFLVGLRAPVFLVAGAMHVSLRRFLWWNFLGLLVAVPGVVVLGYVFGAPLAEGAFFVVKHVRWVVLALVAAGLVYIWLKWRKGAFVEENEPPESGAVDDAKGDWAEGEKNFR